MTRSGLGVGVAAYVMWGVAPLYWKLIADVPAGTTTMVRVVASVVLLLVVAAVRGVDVAGLFRDPVARTRHAVAAVFLVGNWLTYVYAVATDRVIDASLGYFILPLVLVVVGVVAFDERLAAGQTVAVALGAVGVLVLGVESGTVPWIGLVLAASFAVYSVLRKTSPLGSLEGLTVETLVAAPAAVGVLAAAVVTGRSGLSNVDAITPWLSGVVTVAPLLAFASAARRIPLWTVGLLQFIAPLIQFTIGWAGGEAVSGWRWIGFAVIWAGLVVFAADSVRRVAPSPNPAAVPGPGGRP